MGGTRARARGARCAAAARDSSGEDPMTDADLCHVPATELAALIRTKKLSPVELTRAVLARIETVNPLVNAFCTPTPEIALADARRAEEAVMKGGSLGPLHGIPYSIKDL